MKKRISLIGIAIIVVAVVAVVASEILSTGEMPVFTVSATLLGQGNDKALMVFIDNIGNQPLDIVEIRVNGEKIFPAQPAYVSIDEGPMQVHEQIKLEPKKTCLIKMNFSWNSGEEYKVEVSERAETKQIVVKAPSSLPTGPILRLNEASTSKAEDRSLNCKAELEANGLDWVRVMLFTHFTPSWPGFKPVKFYYDGKYTYYWNSTSREFYYDPLPNSALGNESTVMKYYERISKILSSAGIDVELIDSFGLWNLMISREPAIVIMGVDILPNFGSPPIWHGEENQQSLVSKWLKSGGILIWIGDYLAYYYGESGNGSRMYIPLEEPWRINVERGRGDWWLLGYDPVSGSYVNMPLSPTRAGKTLGIKTKYVDRPVSLKGERLGPEVPDNAYFYGVYEERLKEWAWASVAYLPALNGTGGVWYIGVYESVPFRYMNVSQAVYPCWENPAEDAAWDAAMAVIHSVWTDLRLTDREDKDTAYAYFPMEKGYVYGKLTLSTLPLSYPKDLKEVTLRVVAIGYDSENDQYMYDEKIVSLPL